MNVNFSPVDFSVLRSSINGSNEGLSFALDSGFLKECQSSITGWQNATKQLREMDQQIEKIELRAKSPKEISKRRRSGLLFLAGAVAIAASTVLACLWLHGQYLSTLALGIATGSPVALVMLLAIGVAGLAAGVIGGAGTIACLGRGVARVVVPSKTIQWEKPSVHKRKNLEAIQKRHTLSQEGSRRLVQAVRGYLNSLDSFVAQDPADKVKMRRELVALEKGLQTVTRNS